MQLQLGNCKSGCFHLVVAKGITYYTGMFKKLVLIALVLYGSCLSAQTRQEVRDSVKIYFQQGKTELVPSLNSNRTALNRIADSLRTSYADSVYRLRKILVVGGASPEGSVKLNKYLSEERAAVLFNYLSRYGELPDSLKTTRFLGRDWNGLIQLVEDDPDVPHKEATLYLLRKIARESQENGDIKGDHILRLQQFCGGESYNYMYRKLFPELRASRLYLSYEKVWNPVGALTLQGLRLVPPAGDLVPNSYSPAPPAKPFYMDIRTNLLYDALLVPNIGVEFYLGGRWSVVADWMYGWWKSDRTHWFWRTYGGDLTLRKWFGKASKRKPLTGHHIGVNGQIFTYDFETGGKGYLGGKPGATLWEKMNYSVGLEYGYSVPIARRLNLDFSIDLGYSDGTYHEYEPADDCYVWQATKQRHWFGPTKAEVSLVWLIGRGNYNSNKGGRR